MLKGRPSVVLADGLSSGTPLINSYTPTYWFGFVLIPVGPPRLFELPHQTIPYRTAPRIWQKFRSEDK